MVKMSSRMRTRKARRCKRLMVHCGGLRTDIKITFDRSNSICAVIVACRLSTITVIHKYGAITSTYPAQLCFLGTERPCPRHCVSRTCDLAHIFQCYLVVLTSSFLTAGKTLNADLSVWHHRPSRHLLEDTRMATDSSPSRTQPSRAADRNLVTQTDRLLQFQGSSCLESKRNAALQRQI